MARPIAKNKAHTAKMVILCSSKLRAEIETMVVEKECESIAKIARVFLKSEIEKWDRRATRTEEEAEIAKRERLERKSQTKAKNPDHADVKLQLTCSPEFKKQVEAMMKKRGGDQLSDLLRTHFENEIEKWKTKKRAA